MPGQLGLGELTCRVVSPLTDEPAGGAEGGRPGGNVRRLASGDESNGGRCITIGHETPLGQDHDVEDQIADRADRRAWGSRGWFGGHANIITTMSVAAQRILLGEKVERALGEGAPLVALESTILTHGLPRPDNLRAAVEFEQSVIEAGAVPATIAVVDGVARVGLEAEELQHLASEETALKLSARDLPLALAQGASGGTTVAATALLAAEAGIRVFATGGIGGVHRHASTTFDESADLAILASRRITIVSAGIKSILDIGATLERLESLGVSVLVFGTNRFPGFWLTDSGHRVDSAVGTPAEIAAVMQASDALGRPGGILVANPMPHGSQLDPDLHDRLLGEALAAAEEGSVRGKDITPFLLDYVHEHTGGRSVAINLEIVRRNCSLAAAIARAWADLQAPAMT
jgi:pseudouridylate synthase